MLAIAYFVIGIFVIASFRDHEILSKTSTKIALIYMGMMGLCWLVFFIPNIMNGVNITATYIIKIIAWFTSIACFGALMNSIGILYISEELLDDLMISTIIVNACILFSILILTYFDTYDIDVRIVYVFFIVCIIVGLIIKIRNYSRI